MQNELKTALSISSEETCPVISPSIRMAVRASMAMRSLLYPWSSVVLACCKCCIAWLSSCACR